MTDCYTATDAQHGTKCHCGRPAKYHVNYQTGCGHVCGIHKNKLVRLRPGSKVRTLDA